MGCCGDEEEEFLKHLMPNFSETLTLGSTSQASTSGDSDAVISPMNSHFSALTCQDVLRGIFERLPVADLARASCVCRVWNLVASDRGIQVRAFRAPWKLKDVVGIPSSGSFWRDNSLGKFAISHRLVRGDSVASLAVKYSVQINGHTTLLWVSLYLGGLLHAFKFDLGFLASYTVMDIKRLNNMMSDHGIYSRERLLIPVSKPDILINAICYIELDSYAKREVAVLYLEGGPDKKLNSLLNKVSSEQGRRRVIESLKRSMQIDDGTAQYYLSISNGDPRAAISEFSEDLRWERHAGLS
ncbi:F-box protein [Vitis vinifera]|uniref:F-box protein n=1 Tax=Vitis vinifera TaxID=29760 RepID=A0A438KCI2_VITVI|nr:F-box protein [Vitis vinifera]